MTRLGLSQEYRVGLTSEKSKWNSPHRRIKGKKSYDYINRCRKVLNKSQHPFTIQAFSKLGLERNCKLKQNFSKHHT